MASNASQDYNIDLSNFDISEYMSSQLPQSSNVDQVYAASASNPTTAPNDIQMSSTNPPTPPTHRISDQFQNHSVDRQPQPGASRPLMETYAVNPQTASMPLSNMQQQLLNQSAPGPIPSFLPSHLTESLKLQLQQQMRLQQLQQLQNQILQQQIELISGQSQAQREMSMHGLLTPAPSSELRPTPVLREYLSPMTLAQQYNPDGGPILSTLVSPAMTPQTNASTMSAPSAFQQTNHLTPADMFSPLTSPALGPTIGTATSQRMYTQPEWSPSMSNLTTTNTASPQRQDAPLSNEPNQNQANNSIRGHPHSTKRPISDDVISARKRHSPLAKGQANAGISHQQSMQPSRRTQSRVSRQSSLGGSELQQASYGTPSPVDVGMSMPPPARPAGRDTPPSCNSSNTGPLHTPEQSLETASNDPGLNIEPVTPASIMNLGHVARLPTGLVPMSGRNAPTAPVLSSDLPIGPITAQQQQLAESLTEVVFNRNTTPPDNQDNSTQSSAAGSGNKRTKMTPTMVPVKTKQATVGNGVGSTRSAKSSPVIRASAGGNITPKAILPSGLSAEAATQLSQKSNYQAMLEGRISTRGGFTNPGTQNGSAAGLGVSQSIVPGEKKTSHKAAEQKRRDSLKAGFDELRLLLPPIIVDPDSDEPLLPGSAPPRGPQRNLPPGSEDHPNRGVSKLALLRCSNEFIGRLNKRIERRDEEIFKLRDEVRWLRERAGVGSEGELYDERRRWVDLEKDLDEVERDNAAVATGKARVNGVGVTLLDAPKIGKSKATENEDESDGEGD